MTLEEREIQAFKLYARLPLVEGAPLSITRLDTKHTCRYIIKTARWEALRIAYLALLMAIFGTKNRCIYIWWDK